MSARRRSAVGLYVAFARTAARQELQARGAVVGRIAFLGVIVLVFSRLWEVVLARGAIAGASRVEFLWYLAITEWVVLSVPPLHLDLESDIRSGEVAARLPRPVSYLGARLAEAAGQMVVRLGLLAPAGFAFAFALAGGFPADVRGLALAAPLGVLSCGLGLAACAAIGLCAFWLADASPVYWIWQKALFVLGGLLLPLEIYPEWLRGVAAWTPFSAMVNGPGRMAFGFDPAAAAIVAAKLSAWGVLAALSLRWLQSRALRALAVNGG
jgi:ABC-2 type transport system permease protein